MGGSVQTLPGFDEALDVKAFSKLDREPTEMLYTPESDLRQPGRLVWAMWRDLLASRGLAWRLMARDVYAQYRQSVLGYVWAFLPPIVVAAGFTLARSAGVIVVGRTDLPYPAYVMISVMLWQTFMESLNAPLQAVTLSKPVLSKINFPREAIILAKLGEVLLQVAIKLVLIIGIFVWFKIPVT